MDIIRSIVVPTDFSPLSEVADVRAATLACLYGASVHLVHAPSCPLSIAPREFKIPAAVWESIRRAAREKLEEAQKAIERRGIQTVTVGLANSSNAVQAISAAVEAQSAISS